MTVSTYYTKLWGLWHEIQSNLHTPQCSCNGCSCGLGKAPKKVKEKEKLYEFLIGLDSDFAIIRTQILAMKPTSSLGNEYHLVVEDEQQRSITNTKRPITEVAAFEAFVKREPGLTHQANKFMKKHGNQLEHCSFYDKEGHTRDGCFKRVGYPE